MTAALASVVQRAETLAARGEGPVGLALLEEAGEAGDVDACFAAALWRLSGRQVRRHLGEAHTWFGRAAALGHSTAKAIHTAFLANGAGGVRDWPGALAALAANPDSLAQRARALIMDMALDHDGNPTHVGKPETLSTSPQVRCFRKLFSAAECRFLVDLAVPLLEPAVVVDPKSGRMIRNPIRNSDSAAFGWALENPFVHALNRRIAAASETTTEHGEILQVLRYQPGQEYRLHLDALPGESNQRVMTALVYLNGGYDGGETHFPHNGLTVRGGVGDALVFDNLDEAGQPDRHAFHAGRPVTRGTKFIASRWIRARPLSSDGT